MNKADLRAEFLTKRKALTPDDVQQRSLLIAQHFIDFLATTAIRNQIALLHTFLPIQRQNEVDTWPIIRFIWAQLPATQLAVSVTDTTTSQLTHYPLYPTTHLQTTKWGIPEPVLTKKQLPIDSTQIDLVLVPLLIFDKQGHRVGYGGGYYDRFLANCRPNCLIVGLSLFEPIDGIDDITETDIPLNYVITPAKLYPLNEYRF